jgi:cytochrome P450
MSATAENQADLSNIQLSSPETLIDPWETYRRLRDEAPVFRAKDLGLTIVTRYDLIMEVLKDPETYSNASPFVAEVQIQSMLAAPPDILEELMALQADRVPQANTLLTADPPVHGRYRSQVSGLFSAGRVKKMQPYVDQIVGEAIDGFIDEDGPVDFAQRFAFPVPLRIIADRLGIPPEDRDFFSEEATAMASLLRMKASPPDEMLRRAKQNKKFEKFLIALVDKRRGDPKDDLCSALGAARLEDEDRTFNDGEIWSILTQFLVAGHETTTSTFGFAMELLCKNPEIQDRIRGDEKLIRNFVEEALRLEAPVQGLPRLVTRDTELCGVPLKKGETLMLRYGAGNRDERQFPNPDEVDLDRPHPGAHLSFGSGTHHCPGAPLSRQELNRGILAILERMENFRLSSVHPTPKPEPSLILRNLPELWIEFERRSAS